ncbi:MAG: tRNA (guanosine(37)-N1)-methyltransferase TrmD [Parasporobacterium sp.]|nr:tRNA (guanosine(37)-N1)-methyltransferase TrmD [Parasporobacterium sp.]
MKITVLTICPEQFGDFRKTPLIARAEDSGLLELKIVDIREYAPGSFRQVDDSPYGGGAGMILRCQPVLDALDAVRTEDSHTVILAPVGKTYTQSDAHRLAQLDHLILICGHYEGLDARIYPSADELLSVGDYILTGGELPAMVVVDSLMRLVKGSMKEESTLEESFEQGLLEYPQYTRPAYFKGMKVPEILLSGDHKAIANWRRKEALRITKLLRPDLLETAGDKAVDVVSADGSGREPDLAELSDVRAKYRTITKTLIEHNITISTMESCSAGLIASLLTDTEGSSNILKGAFVTYSNEAKVMQGVPPEVIRRYGVYSLETAEEMALACRSAYHAKIGVGITGTMANVDPDNQDSVPGEIYLAIASEKGIQSRKLILPYVPDRLIGKLRAADAVADDLLALLTDSYSS